MRKITASPFWLFLDSTMIHKNCAHGCSSYRLRVRLFRYCALYRYCRLNSRVFADTRLRAQVAFWRPSMAQRAAFVVRALLRRKHTPLETMFGRVW